MKNIVILASGSGSNAENIIKYLENNAEINVIEIVCNRKDAYIFERAKKLNIPCTYIKNSEIRESDILLKLLKSKADFIVLAGFLLKVPENIIEAFPNKIINIHPALLPNYGGKGMYGMHVHQAVKENKETETGITIHYVNENYDEGAIIFQAKTALTKDDTPESIAQKVHQLEYKYFPEVIAKTVLQ